MHLRKLIYHIYGQFSHYSESDQLLFKEKYLTGFFTIEKLVFNQLNSVFYIKIWKLNSDYIKLLELKKISVIKERFIQGKWPSFSITSEVTKAILHIGEHETLLTWNIKTLYQINSHHYISLDILNASLQP